MTGMVTLKFRYPKDNVDSVTLRRPTGQDRLNIEVSNSTLRQCHEISRLTSGLKVDTIRQLRIGDFQSLMRIKRHFRRVPPPA